MAAAPGSTVLRNRTVPAALVPMEKAARKSLNQLQFWLDIQLTEEHRSNVALAESIVKGIHCADTEVQQRLAVLLTRLETDSSQA